MSETKYAKIIDSYEEKIQNQSDSIHTVLNAKGKGSVTNYLYDYYSKYYLSKYAAFTLQDRVLDFGCGLGRMTFEFSKKVKSIKGVDISPGLIEIAKSKVDHYSNVSFDLIKPNENLVDKFDKIAFFGVLVHFDDEPLQKALKNFNEILENDATVTFIEPVYFKRWVKDEEIDYRTKEDFIKAFTEAGFELIIEKPILRSPSYSFDLINKLKIKNALMLNVYRWVEEFTMRRKPETISFYWHLFKFKKK